LAAVVEEEELKNPSKDIDCLVPDVGGACLFKTEVGGGCLLERVDCLRFVVELRCTIFNTSLFLLERRTKHKNNERRMEGRIEVIQFHSNINYGC